MTAVALKFPVGPRRRIAALVGAAMLAAVVVAGCGGEATKDLETLDAPGFSVSMPGKPARSEQPVPTARRDPGIGQVRKAIGNPRNTMDKHGGAPSGRINRSGPPSSASPSILLHTRTWARSVQRMQSPCHHVPATC